MFRTTENWMIMIAAVVFLATLPPTSASAVKSLGDPLGICQGILDSVDTLKEDSGGNLMGIDVPDESLGAPAPNLEDFRYKGQLSLARVKDQRCFGSCTLFGTTAQLEHRAHYRGSPVLLSEDYLILQMLKKKFSENLEKLVQGSPNISENLVSWEGLSITNAFNLVADIGLIPKSVWQPRRSLGDNRDATVRATAFLSGILVKAKKAINIERDRYERWLKMFYRLTTTQDDVEVFYSRETSAVVKKFNELLEMGKDTLSSVESILNGKVKISSADLIFLKRELETAFGYKESLNPRGLPFRLDGTPNGEKIVSMIERAATEYLDTYFGKPPQSFEYEGQTVTPQSFYRDSGLFDPLFEPSRERLAIFHGVVAGDSEFYMNLIGQNLEARDPVVATVTWNSLMSNPTNVSRHIVSMKHYNPLKLSTKELLSSLPYAEYGRHTVMIVDYLLDESGDLIEWVLIQNSWGEGVGLKGFFMMPWESFLQLNPDLWLTERGLGQSLRL